MNQSKAEELIGKYELKENSYYQDDNFPYQERNVLEEKISNSRLSYEESRKIIDGKRFFELKEKWDLHVEKGWYGFGGLGNPTPNVWYDVLDEFLGWIKTQCPDFKIFQIKIKMGSLRMYIGNVTPEVQEEISKLQMTMFDKKLIY